MAEHGKIFNREDALQAAIEAASKSPCQKSQRGVAIWSGDKIITGNNHIPDPFICDGSIQCRYSCHKRAIHAEQHAIMKWMAIWYNRAGKNLQAELLHIKVKDGQPVPTGPPSCWQCSKLILAAGIKFVWLFEKDENGGEPQWKRYRAHDFHFLTMKENCLLTFDEADNYLVAEIIVAD